MTGSSLISTEYLATRLADPNLRVADASWYLPQAGRNPRAEYEAAHIPGAVFFDIDAISDHETDLPHMLPRAVVFASAMRKLGIGDSDFVVFYDGAGLYSAPRALGMMRALGPPNAAGRGGGFPTARRRERSEGGSRLEYWERVTRGGTRGWGSEVKRLFADRGVDLARPVVTSCGSGVTAAIVSLALDIAGAKKTALYDGSWAEWGARADAPAETGGQ